VTCISTLNKKCRIVTARNKSKRRDHDRKILKLSTRCLLETISHFLKLTNIPKVMCNTRRGHQINFFLKISIQEGIFNIKLRDMSLTNWSNYNKSINNSYFCNRGKCLLIIHIIMLRVSLCNQPSFVSLNRPIKISLDLIHLTTTNNTLTKEVEEPNPKYFSFAKQKVLHL
jgi:hypothetical protein